MEEKKYNEVNKVNEEKAEKEKEQKHESKLTFDNSVVQKIAAIAVREIPGVLDMEGGFFSGIQETFGGYNATKGIDAVRGRKKVNQQILNYIIDFAANDQIDNIYIMHSNLQENADELENVIKEYYPSVEIYKRPISSLFVVHTGPHIYGAVVTLK